MGKQAARVSNVLFILVIWFILCTIGSFFVLQISHSQNSLNLSLFLSSASKTIFATPDPVFASSLSPSVKADDGRILLVERFLAKYHSPMSGHGKEFIQAADKNSLDWRLMPAIAFQESNLGKKIPKGSYNPFGWGIYTGQVSGVNFSNWSDAIYAVARGLHNDYLTRGLSTPETIVIRYADEGPNWVFGVRSAMSELSSLEN